MRISSKIFCVMLTILTTLMFTSFVVFAAEADNRITLSKKEYRIKDKVKVTISGSVSENAWIGIEKAGTKIENTDLYEYVSDFQEGNTYEFTAPSRFGKYEIRLFNDNDVDTYLGKIDFTVIAPKAKEGDLKLSKNEFKLNEKSSFTVDGLTIGEISENSWISVEKVGTKLENSNLKEYVSDLLEGNVWEFNVPYKFGKYEVRVFTTGNQPNEENLFGKLEFKVVSSKAVAGDIKLSSNSVLSGDKMTVTVKGVTKGEIDAGAWAGVAKAGTKLENTMLGQYISEFQEGDIWEFNVPVEPGKYELRIFCSSNLQPEEMEYGMFGIAAFTVSRPIFDIEAGYEGISSWAVEEVETAVQQNLVTDKVMADFGKALTREEFCELAIKLYERMTGQEAVPVAKNPFKDTNNPEILKANKLKIVEGVAPDSFAPDNAVTRQEIATMLLRTLRAIMPEIDTTNVRFTQDFYDESEVSDWALEGLMYFNQHDIFRGANGYILPKANTTREQGIALINRVFDKFFNI